jgi:hypothetical protein
MWWPDYNIRFFKKGAVVWSDKIHSNPDTKGSGVILPDEEEYSIIHHHYTSISQFVLRLDRYTTVQSAELNESGYIFHWHDLFRKPLGEFLGRYFATRGFEDGLFGLILSLLQAFSHLIMYLKVWELQGFKDHPLQLNELKAETKNVTKEIDYWFKFANLSKNPVKRLFQKVKNKL